ncbi:hypothetical protein ACJJTC_006336 [Scirpophaga incertulas]
MATVWRSRCAFAPLLVGKSVRILNNTIDLGSKLIPKPLSVTLCAKDYSSYGKSPFVDKITERYDYEIIKNPPEWEYVKRLLPLDIIPKVTPKDNYPSGWIPPKEEAQNLPYFIRRTKHHEIPIYLNLTYRGTRKVTKIKKLDGDIWLLNHEIKKYLNSTQQRYVETRVHELARFIEVKGDFVTVLKEWAYSKGF